MVLGTLGSRQPGIQQIRDTYIIRPVFYVAVVAFGVLSAGVMSALLTRWYANRVADEAFGQRIEKFRKQRQQSSEPPEPLQ